MCVCVCVRVFDVEPEQLRLCLLGLFFHFEECVRQNQIVDPVHLRVSCKFRVDVEKHRHVNLLPSKKPLLLKAEALDLVEVDSCLCS